MFARNTMFARLDPIQLAILDKLAMRQGPKNELFGYDSAQLFMHCFESCGEPHVTAKEVTETISTMRLARWIRLSPWFRYYITKLGFKMLDQRIEGEPNGNHY
jgi:hypothetical protein